MEAFLKEFRHFGPGPALSAFYLKFNLFKYRILTTTLGGGGCGQKEALMTIPSPPALRNSRSEVLNWWFSSRLFNRWGGIDRQTFCSVSCLLPLEKNKGRSRAPYISGG